MMTSPSLEDAQSVLASQPFSTMMGTKLSQYDDEGVTLELELTQHHLQQHGYVHGGVQCYLADNALTFAGGQKLGPAVLTAGVNLTYLRPAAGEKLIARASVQAATSRSAVTQVEISAIKDGQEYVCSVGSGTISTMRK
ncbi:PaaI family thioesterase [Brevibacterium sp. UCMA 11754]|uniref:PaaI family thioesterase n=1 Tax=Brevibacterium sp. UCMA 11754 TaxID=2749198 RepID=UPI001F157528|nr:PaaI family thioesterase [Brevibacterium sp. UCMA 11754]MCF2572845.1 PaaI family thioesterase [Brevibacterium sp. UCMA 11754]